VGSQLVSTWENAFAILKNHLICKMSFRLLFLTYLCSISYIFMIKRQIYLWIIVTWLFFAVFIFYALAFYLIILLLVKINRIPSYVGKKRKLSLSGMIIHITLIVALIFSVSFFCTSMEKTIAECNKIYKCRNMDNIYRIVMNYMGQDCSLEKEVEIQNLANKAYIELTKQNYGFLMDADSIHMCDVLGCDSELNGLYSENGQETHITITPNYLRFNPIMTLNGESVEKMIDYDENVLNILVPEKYMSKENELIKQFSDYLSFNRFQIYERVYKNSSNNIWNPKEEQSLVNIIPIKNGQAFYTFTDIIRNEENNSIVDPVSVVYTNNFHPSYILGEASRVLYFQYDDNVKENIDSYLSKIVGVKGFIKAESIYKEKLLNLRRFVIDSMLSFLWLVLIILSYIEVGILSHKDKIQWINAIDALTIFIAMVICILASQVNIIFVGHIDIVKGIVLLVGIGMMLVLRNYNAECVSEGRSNEI